MVRRLFTLLLVVSTCVAGRGAGPDWKALYDGHRWFELRDAVDTAAPPLYRGAVACAFNDFAGCETTLKGVIGQSPTSGDAAEARGLLIYAYHRTGQLSKAVAEIDALLAIHPGSDNLKAARALFGAFGERVDQSAAVRRSAVRYRMKGGNLFVPVSIGEHAGSYLVDTGAGFSMIAESEARRLGLTVREGGSVTDTTGRSAGARTTVIDELRIGDVRIRNVAALVVRDDQQPFVNLAPDERGVIGFPVLTALPAFRWNSEGTFEIGVPSPRTARRDANLCFDGDKPVTLARFGDRSITMHVDTGATVTHLWPRFASDFAIFLSESGTRGTKRVTGVANSVEVESITVPELTLRVGGLDTRLRPAYVLVGETSSAGQRDHGNLGMDLLGQARSVTIDFRSMTLALQNRR